MFRIFVVALLGVNNFIVNGEIVLDDLCKHSGNFSISGVSGHYIHCIEKENGGFHKVISKCPKEEIFSEIHRMCILKKISKRESDETLKEKPTLPPVRIETEYPTMPTFEQETSSEATTKLSSEEINKTEKVKTTTNNDKGTTEAPTTENEVEASTTDPVLVTEEKDTTKYQTSTVETEKATEEATAKVETTEELQTTKGEVTDDTTERATDPSKDSTQTEEQQSTTEIPQSTSDASEAKTSAITSIPEDTESTTDDPLNTTDDGNITDESTPYTDFTSDVSETTSDLNTYSTTEGSGEISSTDPTTTETLPFKCSANGFYSKQNSCSKFYLCLEGYEDAFALECPKGQTFNPKKQFCQKDYKCGGTDKKFVHCVPGELMPDKTDCAKYYKCSVNSSSGELEYLNEKCPNGLVFNSVRKSCSRKRLLTCLGRSLSSKEIRNDIN